MIAVIPKSTQNGCRHTYIYSKWLLPYLHLLKTVATIPTSTQISCCYTYIYSKQLPPYSTQNGCRHLYIYSKQVDVIMAGQENKRREHILIHKIGSIDGGRGFQTNGNILQIGGNTFYDRKNKILKRIPEFKRSGIGIIAEFCRNPSRFPNQDLCRKKILPQSNHLSTFVVNIDLYLEQSSL
jgi:hypothetical protein